MFENKLNDSIQSHLGEVHNNHSYRPMMFRLSDAKSQKDFLALLQDPAIQCIDKIESQLKELILIENPEKDVATEDIQSVIQKKLGECPYYYGAWAFYPWSKKLIHLLDEEEFAIVRTNRNLYKITPEEREILNSKTIGIVGLSVGQSVAMVLATERLCGQLRLADFDTLELSNLNRIQAGVQDLGITKVIQVARKIAELDPYLKIECFHEGLNQNNMDQFFCEGSVIDLFIEECDDFKVKILSRLKAKALKIPVIMDTSDRGLMDIERFDQEPARPIFHGLLPTMTPEEALEFDKTRTLSKFETIFSWDQLSTRLKASFVETGSSVRGITQLASDVGLGANVAAILARHILLNKPVKSGRYSFEFVNSLDEFLIPLIPKNCKLSHYADQLPLEDMIALSNQVVSQKGIHLSDGQIEILLHSATRAPSGGNTQPWKWLWKNNNLYLFMDPARSNSLLEYRRFGGYISLGAAYENLLLQSQQMHLLLTMTSYVNQLNLFPLIASFHFQTNDSQTSQPNDLANAIFTRNTNRAIDTRELLPNEALSTLKTYVPKTSPLDLTFYTEPSELENFGKLLGIGDRIRLMDPAAHADFVSEIRWSDAEYAKTRDGIDTQSIMTSEDGLSFFRMIKDYQILDCLQKLNLGKAIENGAFDSMTTASAIGLITAPTFDEETYFLSGSIIQKIWLAADNMSIACHPYGAIFFMIARMLDDHEDHRLANHTKVALQDLQNQFISSVPALKNRQAVFLFRLFKTNQQPEASLRRSLNEVFYKA